MPPYKPDFLTNYEAGAKISFGNDSHLNVAVYQEDWKDIQLSFLGENGLTEVRNAGNARIRGIEADLYLRLMPGLSWSTGASYNDAKLRNDFCAIAVPSFDCTQNVDLDGSGTAGDDPSEINAKLADKGTRLPITAKFKLNSRLRYEWNLTSDIKANAQVAASYEGKRRQDVRDIERAIIGNLNSYWEVDTSAGVEKGPWSLDLYVKNLFDVRGQVTRGIQCLETVCGDPDGLTANRRQILHDHHPSADHRSSGRTQVLDQNINEKLGRLRSKGRGRFHFATFLGRSKRQLGPDDLLRRYGSRPRDRFRPL